MKKNLLTIAAILIIAITFGSIIHAQDVNQIRLSIYLDDIKKYQDDVENYISGKSKELYGQYGDKDLIPKVISPKARAAYLKDYAGAEIDPDGLINAALDKLAETIDKPMREYIPVPASFQFKNPADIKILKGVLENLSDLTIFNVGVYNPSWYIVKNEYGLPLRRMKFGYVWAKNNADDQPYCVQYQIELRQEYAGGGTYGETYGWKDWEHHSRTFRGCPASVAKKTVPSSKVSPKTSVASTVSPTKISEMMTKAVTAYKDKNYVETIRITSEVIKLKPDHEPAYFYRGASYLDSKQYALAVADYTKAIAFSTQDDVKAENTYNRCQANNALKNTTAALTDCSSAIVLNPQYFLAYFERGNIYYNSGKTALALKDYSKVIELKPDYALAYTYRADCYDKLGQKDLANQDRETAKSLEK